jgi:hypothetical protein
MAHDDDMFMIWVLLQGEVVGVCAADSEAAKGGAAAQPR